MSMLNFFRKFFPAPAPQEINFTPRAQTVLELAHKSAKKENREVPTSSDVAIGLLQLSQGVACNVLKRFGIDENTIKKAAAQKSDWPYTRLLPVAQQEMRYLHHTYLGTEHLLLAILSDNKNPLSATLSELGFTTAIIREEILRELDPFRGPPAE